jgi:hypothetical protein
LLVLSGCSSSDATDAQGSSASSSASSPESPAAPDNVSYLQSLRSSGDDQLANTADDLLLKIGGSLCEVAGQNPDPAVVKGAIVRPVAMGTIGSAGMGLVATAAFTSLCPQHRDLYNKALAVEDVELGPGITATEFTEVTDLITEDTETASESQCVVAKMSDTWESAASSYGGEASEWEKLLKEWAGNDPRCQ